MFDIAWSEFLVVAVVALVVVGPKDLPALLRTVGKTVATLRRMAGDFQTQFNEALKEAELDGLKDEITGLKDSATKMVSAPDPFKMARDEIRGALSGRSTTPSALAGAAATASEDAPAALAPAAEPTTPPSDEADRPLALNGAGSAHSLPDLPAPSDVVPPDASQANPQDPTIPPGALS